MLCGNRRLARGKPALFHPDSDRNIDKRVAADLGPFVTRRVSVRDDNKGIESPIRYAYRSFDPQWIIPDHRFLSRARPKLWEIASTEQVFLTALAATSPQSGPAVTLAGQLVDHDHYKSSFNGRVFPLWLDAEGTRPNLSPAILSRLAETYGRAVPPADLMAYIAAMLAHPAFTARFAKDLRQPGLRVPITANAGLFAEAVALGREVIWLHTYGERFNDAAEQRPKGPPRMAPGTGPTIPVGGAIPPAPEPLPETMEYDADTRRLRVGKGHIDNVMPEVWAYEVSGKQVVHQWFSYRKRDRSKPPMGDRRPPSPLSAIQPDGWLPEYTTDLMNLLHVLGRLVLLEPKQAALLEQILREPLLSVADLGLATDNGDESEEDDADGPSPA